MRSFMNMQALLDRIGLVAPFMGTFKDFIRLMCFFVILKMGLRRVSLPTCIAFEIL